jgi:rod shape-determining protein MreD
MRLLPYILLAYVALGVQVGAGPFVSVRGASPNLVLVAATFIGLYAPREAALLGCMGMGLMQDLLTLQPPGLYALAFGLVGLLVVGVHQLVDREHPLTHVALAFVGGLIVSAVLLIHGLVHPAMVRTVGGSAVEANAGLPPLRAPPTTELLRAAYTAALAPFVFALLLKLKRTFGFKPDYRRLNSR